MAIKIATQKTVIPVQIGELEFSVDVADEAVKKVKEGYLRIKEEVEAMQEQEDYEEDFNRTKEVLKQSYNLILGDEAFEALYDQTPSITLLAKYLMVVVESLNDEFNKAGFNQSQADKAKKYLKQNR
ncbi:hypothetical protein [Halalkalibacter hemicellulosilyticus]|uniref:Phage protein n=1 Tax=Halalkalibacter hemicellulosilyticusJCM 9152 TaxID=1236971 RepID=W4QIM6_9BACI|nr:hypothetical protein [Halalkalibacter hemicellulosilyticus]GAE31921.1 hypothetical protein JCM9152_3421 [Halalkalibacter hemicellulosilyticusJCM 9152]